MKIHSAPWEIHKDSIGASDDKTKYVRVRGTVPGGKFHIADVRFFVCDDAEVNSRNENEALEIARVIAAAPELLEALIPFSELKGRSVYELNSMISKAVAAIKKARGF